MPRPTPFDLVFGRSAPEVFPRIQAALEAAGYDPRDRDRFLMIREVVTLVRDLRPEEGLGEGIDQLAALVHHTYLHWLAGARTIELTSEGLAELLRSGETEDGIEEPSPFMPRCRSTASGPKSSRASLPSPSTAAPFIRLRTPLSECWVFSVFIPSARDSAWWRPADRSPPCWHGPTGPPSSRPRSPAEGGRPVLNNRHRRAAGPGLAHP